MSAFLSIRLADDIWSAIASANQFLAYRRRGRPAMRASDAVLGVWLCDDLDSGLRPSDDALDPWIMESFSLSGSWSMSWLAPESVPTANTASEQRRRLVAALVRRGGVQRGTFLPVFDSAETLEEVAATIKQLRAEHPAVVSTTCLIDDGAQGLIIGSSSRGYARRP